MNATEEFVRPRLVVSRCMGFDAVRYDGKMIESEGCAQLFAHADVLHVCPELSIDLGVPRSKVRLVPEDGGVRLVQPSTGVDLTDRMQAFAEKFTSQLSVVDGYVLKSTSPSCGLETARIYEALSGEGYGGLADGIFAAQMRRAYPNAVGTDEQVLDEGGVAADLFLRRLFLRTAWRVMAREHPDRAALQAFHARHKLTLMLFSPAAQKRLGQIAADGSPEDYGTAITDAVAADPVVGAHVNVLQHAVGYFREKLAPDIYRQLVETIDTLPQQPDVPAVLRRISAQLRELAIAQGVDYIAMQSYLRPYPPELGG